MTTNRLIAEVTDPPSLAPEARFAGLGIAVLIPCYNEEASVAQVVTDYRTALPGARIYVFDNNSTDRTAERAREEGAKVVFEPVNQIGRARNTGAATASGRWLLFIDADSRPSRELLEDAAKLTLRADVLLAGATVTLDEAPWVVRPFCWVWNAVSRLRKLVAGSFILVRAAAFREVGGFDLRFFAGEEIDLALRLQKRIGRRDKQGTVILHRHPLVTSGRKLRLYRKGEMGRFLLKSLFRPMKTTTSRDDCDLWYDGRR